MEEMQTVSQEPSFKEKSRNFLKGQNLNQQIKMTLKGCQVVTDVNLKKKKKKKKSQQKEKRYRKKKKKIGKKVGKKKNGSGLARKVDSD